jgi:F-type H+-transporting ATPase subunit a
VILGLEFQPVNRLVDWKTLFGSGPFAPTRVTFQILISLIIIIAFYVIAGRKKALVPTGAQNVAESAYDFIQDGIILQTMGEEGLGWTTFLITLFSFILVLNIWEVIPLFQMPVTAHIAIPAELAILVWFLFNIVGIKSQGFIGYFKGMAFPPLGDMSLLLKIPLYCLITPIEIVSTLFVRPLSLAVRLFANMLAGHLLLATFAVLSAGIFFGAPVFLRWGAVLPFGLLIALYGFEVLVSFLQAFIFTILAAVYIGGAMHPEH